MEKILGEDPGSSSESKWQDLVLKMWWTNYEPQEQSVDKMNAYVKISIWHSESHKQQDSLMMG